MKTLTLMILILCANGCGKSVATPASFTFQTERLSNEMLRMENDEVVCYRWDGGGLSCRFKE